MNKYVRAIIIVVSGVLVELLVISSINAQDIQTVPSKDAKQINACYIESPIKMDGILNESVWDMAEIATDFIQTEPEEGAPATEKTEVRILYDTENLYIGVTCYDSEPDKIIHNEMQVDGFLEYDDNLTVIFDTFNDKRGGFYFRTNPNGARLDAKIGGRGSSRRRSGSNRGPGGISTLGEDRVNYDWNGIWDVAARITDEGWVAEIVIPFVTLRFQRSEIQDWGINFRRIIRHKNELNLWTSWGRDDGLLQLTKLGTLCDLRNLKRGSLVELKPYVLTGVEKTTGKDINENLKSGIDIKYPITSNLTLDFTSFTDFAQVEADQTMINLTRFDLRYPEKREFFLEGAEIFEFSSPYTSPFYSRNIGITPDRDQVPILAGAKVTGKAGRYNIGVLNMQTDDKKGYPSTNYGVVRVKRDFLEKSSFGFIATNFYNTEKDKEQSLGIDFTYETDKFLKNKNIEISADITENRKKGVNHGNRAGRISIRYPNDLIEGWLYYKVIGENYDPEMGFVERRGVKQYMTELQLNPRPDIPHVKQLHFSLYELEFSTDMNGKLITREARFSPLGITTKSEDYFSIFLGNSYEYLEEDFNIFNDVIIPSGDYEWWNYEISFRTNSSRPLSFDVVYEMGDFFNGEKTTIGTGINYNLNKHISLITDMIYNDLVIGSRKLDTREFSLRLNTNISTRLNARTYVQWNNEDKLANVNFRIHFIPQIGSDIYFVYNHVWDGYQNYKTTYNTAISKIAYRIAF